MKTKRITAKAMVFLLLNSTPLLHTTCLGETPGLPNPTNQHCFFNAALQCLTHLPALNAFLDAHGDSYPVGSITQSFNEFRKQFVANRFDEKKYNQLKTNIKNTLEHQQINFDDGDVAERVVNILINNFLAEAPASIKSEAINLCLLQEEQKWKFNNAEFIIHTTPITLHGLTGIYKTNRYEGKIDFNSVKDKLIQDVKTAENKYLWMNPWNDAMAITIDPEALKHHSKIWAPVCETLTIEIRLSILPKLVMFFPNESMAPILTRKIIEQTKMIEGHDITYQLMGISVVLVKPYRHNIAYVRAINGSWLKKDDTRSVPFAANDSEFATKVQKTLQPDSPIALYYERIDISSVQQTEKLDPLKRSLGSLQSKLTTLNQRLKNLKKRV